MKKTVLILLVAVLCLATVAMTACKSDNDYLEEDLQKVYHRDFAEMTVTVQISDSSTTLTGEYKLTKTDTGVLVDYTYQEFAPFDVTNDSITAPQDKIVQRSGHATLINNVITNHTGDELNISVSKLRVGFNFDAHNLEIESHHYDGNWKKGMTTYTINVPDPVAFAGIQCDSMGFVAMYDLGRDESTMPIFTLYYTAGNVATIITYTVTKV